MIKKQEVNIVEIGMLNTIFHQNILLMGSLIRKNNQKDLNVSVLLIMHIVIYLLMIQFTIDIGVLQKLMKILTLYSEK